MKYFINAVEVTPYVIDSTTAKASSYLDRISANTGSLKIDAIQLTNISTLENQTIQIQNDSGTAVFTGFTQKARNSIGQKFYILPFKDKWQLIKDTICTDKTWKDTSLYNIIVDIIEMTSETSYLVQDPDITVNWFSVTNDDKVKDVLDALAESLKGDCYYSADGVLAFTAGFAAPFSTTTQYDFGLSSVSDVTVDSGNSEYDHSSVSFVKHEFKENSDEVYNATTSNNAWLIPPEGIGVDDDYFVQLTDDIYSLDATVEFEADTELTFVQSVYNSNFQTGSQPKRSDRVQIRITNSSATTKEVRLLRINGKVLRTIQGKAVYSTGTNALEISSSVVDDAEWAGKLAQFSYEERAKDQNSLQLAELDFTPDLGEKFNFDSVRYVLNSISLTHKTVSLAGLKDRISPFVYDSASITYIRENEFTELGDGLPPEPPTNFALATSQGAEYNSIITASWDASTSNDVSGYELEYKPQGAVWGSASSTTVNGLSIEIEVNELITYDVRVRSTDVEGYYSDWLEDSVKSHEIDGDGSTPSASFVSAQCTASIINDKKIAHLVWTCSNPDVKQFSIKYSDDSEAVKYAITRNITESWFGDNLQESNYNKATREAYIEVDTSAVWSFILLVEDHDEYVRNTYPSGVIELNFTDISTEPVPNTPALSTYSTDEDQIIWRVTSPSNSEIDWKLNLEYKKADEDWSEAESITITGDEGYRFDASTYFYVKNFVKPSYKEQVYNGRVRFINNENETSSWSSTANATVPAAYSISSPNPPTNLVLSTYQSDYKAQIGVSWTASTSNLVVAYEIEYKLQGTTWSNSTSTTVRDATSAVLEVKELLYYDVRVRAVDEYDLNSVWVEDSIKSYNVTGDGSTPPNYGFDHSECTASIINEKKLAYLKWRCLSTPASDIAQFIIRYSNEDDINDYAISRSPTGLWSEPTQEKEVKISGTDEFETYIEIDKSAVWNFILFVEDYDGNIVNYYGSGDDGVIQLDFTNVSTEPVPNTAGLAVYTTDEDYITWTVTAPSNVGKDWKLELEYKESTDDWSQAKKSTIAGDKGYQYNPSTNYYVKTFVIPFYENKDYDGRARFTNNENESGSWSTIRQATVPAAYSIATPNPPTGLTLSTLQSDYKSIIRASWTASTSPKITGYEIEYKLQGKAWSESASTTVRDEVTTDLEVEENLWYDVRIRSVDEYSQNSAWVTSEILSFDVVGDGLEPNPYKFSTGCVAVVKNRKRYAKLLWEPYSSASTDIKTFHIVYSNLDDEANYTISKGSGTLEFDPSNDRIKSFDKNVFEAYIEVDEPTLWNFVLFVEDYDGYIRNYLNTSSPSNDGFLQLNFTGTTIPGNTPSTAPTLYASFAVFDYIEFRIVPPSNVEKEWTLQVQLSEITSEWSTQTYDYSGKETYQWQSGNSYYTKIFIDESDKERVFKARARFADENGNVSSWSTVVYDTVPISYGSVPGTPLILTVSGISDGGHNFIKLNCNDVINAERYKWYITYGTNLNSAIYFEAETTESEVYIEVPSFDYRYNYAHVIASNSFGDSGRKYVSTGW